MTASVAGTAPMVLSPTREELIRALGRRHPRISDERLGKLFDRRLARGNIDVFLNQTGEIDIRLTGAMRRKLIDNASSMPLDRPTSAKVRRFHNSKVDN